MSAQSPTVADQGGLAGAYQPMGTADAAALLQAHFGLSGRLTRFATEKDDTFRVSTPTGRFVLKIANPTEPWEEVAFQNAMLRYAKERDPSLPIPQAIPARDGREMFVITDASGAARITRLLTYLDGTPLCDTDSSAQERIQIGRMLARMRRATEGFAHPGAERVYAWDVRHLLSLEPLLAHVPDPDQRRALAAGLARFADLTPQIAGLRQQVLHNDFSKSNIVVDHDAPEFVRGIIDFGDAVKTAIAVDVSTACLNQLPQSRDGMPESDLFWRARDILSGYLALCELTEQELALIPHLTMGRVVARALLSLWRASLFPENQTYILRNTEQGWHQLDWFLARSPDQISDLLMQFSSPTGPTR